MPAPERHQALHLLVTAAVTVGHKPQQAFLPGSRQPLDPDRRAEGAPLTEAEQRPDPPPLGPGRPGHHPKLQAQGQLPAGRMGPGGCAKPPHRRPPVVTGGGTAIGAGQVKSPSQRHRLQRSGQQIHGGPEGIEIHQLMVIPPKRQLGQQVLGGAGRGHHIDPACQRSQVGVQQRQTVRIGIVSPHRLNRTLQAVTEAANATARHQIQYPHRPPGRQAAGQQHAQVPGGPRSSTEETGAGLHHRASFAIVSGIRRGACRLCRVPPPSLPPPPPCRGPGRRDIAANGAFTPPGTGVARLATGDASAASTSRH